MNSLNIGAKIQRVVVSILSFALIILMVFYGYLPESYNYQVGTVADTDIYANRSFIDTFQTEYEAVLAKNSVRGIFIRSEEISSSNVSNVKSFFSLVEQARTEVAELENRAVPEEEEEPVVEETVTIDSIFEGLKTNISSSLDIEVDDDDLMLFLTMTRSSFSYIKDKGVSITEILMIDDINSDSLTSSIAGQIDTFKDTNPSYSNYADALSNVLNLIIVPNSVFDSDATDDAAENAYLQVKNNPVVVERGAKVVSSGEVITEHSYQCLLDLELIRVDTFNVVILLRITVYIVLIALAIVFYLGSVKNPIKDDLKIFYMMILTFLIPVAASVYLSDISSVLSVVLFFTAICSTYVSTSVGIILSFMNLLIVWPVYSFNTEMFVINMVAILITASIAGRKDKHVNSAALILLPSVASVASALAFNFLNSSTQDEYIESVALSGLAALISLVAAVGLTPIYDLVTNAVTPVRLIYLSQPGHPLLKRLFLEASGTYQHSLMVANLSDAAAEAIGADSMLCKVAAYYHDIGKLDNPLFFTENQADGVNPHDNLKVMDSVSIITKHPEDGMKLGKKHKLPEAILKIIDEHHGTTYPAYFFTKACEEAKAAGLEMPDVNNFRYRGHIPSSRESAIVMIADTCEAAIRSTKKNNLEDVEILIRKLIKNKIEQDQLISSGLSFDDIEKIVNAFKQVYAGAFHERIKYPE